MESAFCTLSHWCIFSILNFISLCVMAVHCVRPILPCPPGPCLSENPLFLHVTAVHKAFLSLQAGQRYECKQTHTSELTLSTADRNSHSQLCYTSDLPPLFRCIHNELGSKSISHISCFPFDIQMDLFAGCPANKMNSLADSNLVTNSSHSLPTTLHIQYLMFCMRKKRKYMLCYVLLVYVCSFVFPWE